MMLTVDRKVFADVLDGAMKFVVRRSTFDALRMCLLRAGGGKLEIVSTNFDALFCGIVEAGIEVEGQAACNAEMLRTFVREATDVAVRVQSVDGFVEARAGRAWSRIPALPPESFPALFTGDQPDVVSAFAIDGEALAGAIDATSYALSDEKTRYYLNGTCWRLREGRVVLCASDGHALSVASLALPEGAEDFSSIIVPPLALPPLSGTVQVAVSPAFIRFTGDGWSVASKLIDATFPDYTRIVPRITATAVVDRGELLAAVERCAAAADKASAVDLVHDTPGELVVRCLGAGDALVEDVVAADGATFVVCMNRALLAATLSSFNSENIEIGLAEVGAAIRFSIPGEKNRFGLVMPMVTATPQRIGAPGREVTALQEAST